MRRTDRAHVPRLVWVPDTADGVALERAIERATAGRFHEPVGLWLRFRGVATRDVYEMLVRIRARCRDANVLVLLGGRVDLAIAVAADGVHLPSHGLGIADARRLVGDAMLVGTSCHDARELAEAKDADYVTLSPVNPVPNKGEALGWPRFSALVEGTRVPVLALGGLGASDVAPSRRAGAAGVAVARAVRAESEHSDLRGFLRAFADARLP